MTDKQAHYATYRREWAERVRIAYNLPPLKPIAGPKTPQPGTHATSPAQPKP